jgi:hypothetical protein
MSMEHHYQWVSQVEMGHLKHGCVSLLEGKGLFVRVANHRRFVYGFSCYFLKNQAI